MKLSVGAPGDAYEQEADRLSEQVMRMPEPQLRRACDCGGECAECRASASSEDVERLQPKRAGSGDLEPNAAPPIVQEALSSPGQDLDGTTRAFMEPRFGHDFSRVRVHTDTQAAESSQAVNALAYTVGRDVVFGAGQYQPHTSAGRQLLAHELSHTIQQGAAPSRQSPAGGPEGLPSPTPSLQPTLQRAFKFELQTANVVWKTAGKKEEKLPRKFGPGNKQYLHKGVKGKKATKTEEGTAVELQSEEGGFVEFETPKWFRKWCDVKERIQEAVDMTDTISKSTPITGKANRVAFPFNIDHLRKPAYSKGLDKGESLEVEIADPSWTAQIQSSEDIELTQYESLLREHEQGFVTTFTLDSAQKILDKANTAKLPAADLVDLLGFLQIIVNYAFRGQNVDVSKSPAKFTFFLMARTSFSSMYRTLLSKEEKKLFNAIVTSDGILKELGLDRKSKFFKSGFKGQGKAITVYEWLVSIMNPGDDLLSPPAGGSQAMGRFDVETAKGKKDTGLVKFETRGSSSHTNNQAAKDWVAYAEKTFKAAHTNRPRTGDTELKYDPAKCP